MSKRLDVSALISIAGEDKVRKELNKRTWYFNLVDTNVTTNNIPNRELRRLIVPNNVKPLEYAFFNSPEFLGWIVRTISYAHQYSFLDKSIDKILEYVYEDDIHDIPSKYMNKVWKVVEILSRKDLNDLFVDSIKEGIYAFLYDGDTSPVFPVEDKEIADYFMSGLN